MLCVDCGTQVNEWETSCNCEVIVQQPAMTAAAEASAEMPPNRPTLVMPNVRRHRAPQISAQQAIKSPGLALLLSFLFPGGGQFYNGEAGKGIVVLVTFWIGGITYLWSLFDACNSAKRINRVGF